MPHRIRLTYFNIEGRAEATRLALFIGGIVFEDERLAFEEFPSVKDSLPFGSLPVMVVDGHVMCQSIAQLNFAGRLANLLPDEPFHASKIYEVIYAVEEFSVAVAPFIAEKDETKKREIGNNLKEKVFPDSLGKLEKILQQNKRHFQGEYSVGQQMTIADLSLFVLYRMLKNMPAFGESMASCHPTISKAHDLVDRHPKVMEWVAAHQPGKGRVIV